MYVRYETKKCIATKYSSAHELNVYICMCEVIFTSM